MRKSLLLLLSCVGVLSAQDREAKETPHNVKYIANLRGSVLMDRLGSGAVQVADNGDLIFADGRGRQSFLYAVSPTKGIYRLSLNIVRTEKLSARRNVFQGVLIRKDGIYRAGGITDYKKLAAKLNSIPVDDIPTRIALAGSGWGHRASEPWAFFKPPFSPPASDLKIDDAFFSNLTSKRLVGNKYRMGAQFNEYGDIIQTDGLGTLTFQYAVSPNAAVYKISPESSGDLNFPSENAHKGFVIKSKGIYSTGYLFNYIYPQSRENEADFMASYATLLNGEENINWKKLSREPWFIYHKDPKTNANIDKAFIAKLGSGLLRDNFSQKTVRIRENGDLIFDALGDVYFKYALSPTNAVYQISQNYAENRGFSSTNVFFGVIIKGENVYTGSSRFTYEEPDRKDENAVRLYDERRKSIYNIDWRKTVIEPWITIQKE